MKVFYPGPGDTYHPKLGKLIANKSFDLADEEAKKYIESGLLKETEEKTAGAGSPRQSVGADSPRQKPGKQNKTKE